MEGNRRRRLTLTLVSLSLSFVFVLSAILTIPASATTTYTEKFYFHVDPNSNYQVGTINTGGVTFNSTTLGLSSSGNTKSGGATSSYSQNWYLSQLLAGGITVAGTPAMDLDLYASTASTWNYTLQIIEATSSGSTIAVLSSASCSNSCLSLTTSQALYNSFSFGSISSTTIPSGDELQVSISISQSRGTNTLNLVVENNNPSLTSFWTVPLTASPVAVNSITLSPQSITNPQTSTATISVSDAFGLYDIASASLSASVQGVTAISSQSMSAASGNSPTAYTGSWTTVVNPGATSYASYSGSWFISSTVTDQSGNTYSSASPSVLTYSGSSGNCVSCTTASGTGPSNNTGGGGLTLFQEYIIFATIVIIALLGIMAWRRR
jgi:hypothetical protein